MDEDIEIINTNTRSEKIKNFFIDNKKILLSIIVVIILSLLIFFGYSEFKKNQKIKLSNLYNSIIIEYDDTKKIEAAKNLIEIVNKKDPTYSLLSLYFIIDNNLISDKNQINTLFDILIKETSLDKEIKNLVIYKKGLFNADEINENELLSILNPLIKSESIWKSHALYLLAEFFYSKNEKQKSKDFFNQILNLKNSNPDILKEAQKRLNRDLSD
jgi:predicted negative regulator of RcsB-dependent stress response|tara:strand:+ start:434 stop:1078 length:645 start_codon:yes stop_codon:yes gene_type:complete